MTQYGFTEETFRQAVIRAREKEQAELAVAAAGEYQPSLPISDMLRQLAEQNRINAICGYQKAA